VLAMGYAYITHTPAHMLITDVRNARLAAL
jgi:hypothetical protein